MNIRKAILKAADSIEQNPKLFDFYSIKRPDSGCGTPGCAIGWVAFHLGFLAKEWPLEMERIFKSLGVPSSEEFYGHMFILNEEWSASADACAAALRLYADKYHPAQGIPDSVLAIFEEGFMCKVQAE